jgi:hypothetical protein
MRFIIHFSESHLLAFLAVIAVVSGRAVTEEAAVEVGAQASVQTRVGAATLVHVLRALWPCSPANTHRMFRVNATPLVE